MEFVLIGFEYNNERKLPGIIIDLYLAYQFIKSFHKNPLITILSDIKKDSKTKVVRDAILENIVDSNILSFVKDCKKLNIYNEFKSSGHYNNLDSTLLRLKGDNLFIYYTGHSKNGNIILPNNSLYSFNLFKKQISKFKSVLCILDCCESTGLNLPFKLVNNVYRFENEGFDKSKIICISSSLSEQDSIIMKTGSLFTRYLFRLLINKKMSLPQLLKRINSNIYKIISKYNTKQTVNVYSSYPDLTYIFGWLYGNINIDIRIDKIYKCIEIN